MRRKVIVVLAALGALAALASAQTAGQSGGQAAQPSEEQSEVLRDAYACSEIDEDSARLACFDHAVASLQQAERSGELVTVDRAQAERVENEAFGFTIPSLPRLFTRRAQEANSSTPDIAQEEPRALDEIEFEIDRVVASSNGHAGFVMTNGQVWRQVDSVSARMARPGGKVTIRRAALGSYLMHVEAGGPAIRVRREE